MGSSPAKLPVRRLLAEFFAIFAGVVLGLLADDWRAGRDDAADRTEILRLIRSDLEADLAELETRLADAQADKRSAVWLVESWGRDDLPLDSLYASLNTFYVDSYYQPTNAAFESLRSADRLDLVRDDELRAQIVDYFETRQVFVGQSYETALEADQQTRQLLDRHVALSGGGEVGTLWPPARPQLTLRSSLASLYGDSSLRNAIVWSGRLADGASEYSVSLAINQNQSLQRLLTSAVP